MTINRISELHAKFDLLYEHNILETIEMLFSSEIDHFRVLGCIVEVECPAPGYQRKKICKIKLPANWGRKS